MSEPIRSFELQTFKAGQWTIQGIFSDPDLALFEAKRYVEGDRFVGVRVVEESYNETLNDTKARTIFSGGPGVDLETAGIEQRIAVHRHRQKYLNQYANKPRPGPNRHDKEKFRLVRLIAPFIFLMVLVLIGIAALIALQTYFLPNNQIRFNLWG